MKHILIILLFFANTLKAQDLLKEAEKAYDSRKYKEAISKYEQLLDQGYRSYQLYFNLGNAYYRNNDLGRAIYNYELARKAKPDDEDVRINLGIASSKTIDRIDARENFFINAVKTNVLTSFSTSAWGWLSVAAAALFAGFVYWFVCAYSSSVKRLVFIGAAFFFIIFLCTYIFGYSAVRARYQNKFAIVLAKEVNILNEPTEAARSKFTLHEGTKIRVVEHNGDWLLIKLDNGNEGWMKVEQAGII